VGNLLGWWGRPKLPLPQPLGCHCCQALVLPTQRQRPATPHTRDYISGCPLAPFERELTITAYVSPRDRSICGTSRRMPRPALVVVVPSRRTARTSAMRSRRLSRGRALALAIVISPGQREPKAAFSPGLSPIIFVNQRHLLLRRRDAGRPWRQPTPDANPTRQRRLPWANRPHCTHFPRYSHLPRCFASYNLFAFPVTHFRTAIPPLHSFSGRSLISNTTATISNTSRLHEHTKALSI
jgi:hypothetical protein